MTFRVGQKVVCVRVGGFLEQDAIYTITSINWPYLRVDCKPDGFTGTVTDYGYFHDRFRPLVERKTDISVFTEILRKASKPARTPAMSQHQGN